MKIVIYTSDGDQCSDNWFETSMSYRIIAVDFYFIDICQEKHRIMILKTAHDDDDEDDFVNDDSQ